MDDMTFRTNDGTRWGAGQGSDLTAAQIDINFWALFSAVTSLQDHAAVTANGIVSIAVTGRVMYITLTNDQVLGPYNLPVAAFNPRGQWQPITLYAVLDVIYDNGSLYSVNVLHTSDTTFNAGANDGHGNDLYTVLLEQPANELPDGGLAGQVLTKSTGSPYATEWASPTRNLAIFIEDQPASGGELLLDYLVPEPMLIPAGSTGKFASAREDTTTDVTYSVFKNATLIGTVNFLAATPDAPTFTFAADTQFEPTDHYSILGPIDPDGHQANISITIQALVQG